MAEQTKMKHQINKREDTSNEENTGNISGNSDSGAT